MARDENMIAALKRERAGYVSRGLDDRVAQVDKQLKLRGYKVDEDSTPDVDPDDGPPAERTAEDPGKQTADAPPPAKKTAAKKTAASTPAE